MSRSIKKGPYVESALMKRIVEMNKSAGRHPVTPWGVPTKGHRTRNPKKASSRLIIRRRKK